MDDRFELSPKDLWVAPMHYNGSDSPSDRNARVGGTAQDASAGTFAADWSYI